MFDAILGHEPIKTYLTRAIQIDQLPHALIFVGKEGIGKTLFAQTLASHFLATSLERIQKEIHPDFYPVRPEGKSGVHTIDAIRLLIETVQLVPFEARAKCFLIYHGEKMSSAAGNALLKTLEEPTFNTYFIFLCSTLQTLLPTIQSRCTTLHFQPLSSELIASELKRRGLSETSVLAAQGSLGKALQLAKKESIEQPVFDLLCKKWPYFAFLEALEEIEKKLKDEDPVEEAKNIEDLFSLILMWYRDQYVRKIGGSPLFYPQAPQAQYSLPRFEQILETISSIRSSHQRNIKLSTCLEQLYKI